MNSIENPSSDVAAELPSFVGEEAEVARDRVNRSIRRSFTPAPTWIRRRQEDLVNNRITLLKSMEKEIIKDLNFSEWEEDFDPKRPLGEEEADFRDMHSHRCCWERFKGLNFGAFEDNSKLMKFVDKQIWGTCLRIYLII